MKQFKYLLFIAGIALLLSCESQLSTIEDLTSLQEKYVIGAPLGIEVKTGDRKAEVKFVIPADKRIAYGILEWEDLGESKELKIDIDRDLVKIDTFEVFIEDLAEGIKNFEITLYDEEGDKSKTANVIAVIYGPDYQSTLTPRRISEIKTGVTDDPDVDIATLIWSYPLEQVQQTTLTWHDRDGEEHTEMINNDADTTRLVNYDSSTKITIGSVILPKKDALDEFVTPVLKYSYPVIEIDMDKTRWQYVNLGNDVPFDQTGGYGNWNKCWNGDSNSYYATLGGNSPRPYHLTVDLGVKKVLSQFSLKTTGWAPPFSPREYEIWSITDITDAETAVKLEWNDQVDTRAEWKAAMIEKGWTQLIDHNHRNDERGNLIYAIDNDIKSRYVRIVIKESYDAANGDCVMGEFGFKCFK